MSAPRASTSRRAALGGALAAVSALGGCSGDALTGDGESAPGRGPGPTDAAPVDADTALVEEVLGGLRDAQALLEAAGRGAPALRRELRPLRAAHRAHVRVLEGERASEAGEDATGDPLPSTGRRRVLRRERQLRRAVAAAAARAESGALAGLLASISASTAQHLAALNGNGS